MNDPQKSKEPTGNFLRTFFLKTTIHNELKNLGLTESIFDAWLDLYLTGLYEQKLYLILLSESNGMKTDPNI